MKANLLSFPIVCCLAACSMPGSDLDDWMQETQRQAENSVRPVEVPTLSKPAQYIDPVINGLNVFDPKRIRANQQTGVNAPNPNRTKEILENFSLESVRYVGSIKRGNQVSAFIEANNHTYTVHIGNYIGQNHGRITAITPDKIIVNELVENSYGEWENLPAELGLNEKTEDSTGNQSKTN